MSLPVLNLTRGIPEDARELARLFNDLNFAIRKDGARVYAGDQRFMNQIAAGNKQSTQSLQPLSSADSGGGFASISIASHNVVYASGTVSFNSGTISGLPNSTKHYVYADDEGFQGGAVTYLATTNPNLITSSRNRYYLGSITTDAPAGGGTSGNWGGGGGGNGGAIP